MTNWVTIKIPEEVRDDAREAEGTYADIMRAGLNGDTQGNTHTQSNTHTHTTNTAEIIEELRDELSMAPDPGVDEEQIVDDVTKRLDDLETELKTQIESLQR